jgi:hypothetical protein
MNVGPEFATVATGISSRGRDGGFSYDGPLTCTLHPPFPSGT